jgi:hypothetical protein
VSTDIINKLPPRQKFVWMAAAVKWADDIGPQVRSKLKEEAPVSHPDPGGRNRPGRLRDSIRYERRTRAPDVDMYFNAYTPYAEYVINSTRAHDIFPKAARYLHFWRPYRAPTIEYFVGPRGSGAHVSHPGTKANKFNERAMSAMRQTIEDRFVEIMREAMGGK